MPHRERDRLDEYRAKRRASATPEPFGGSGAARPRLYVMHKHAATSLHYDLRLEWDGVLLSWAVPKGPSLNPEVKRLAMRTEDHPVEYGDFEGIIPKGNYGAGQVIVWDQGAWVPLEDPGPGLEKGKLLFELKGHKLGGVWTLFRTGARDDETQRQWILMKKPDGWAEESDGELPEASVLSGLTLKELKEGSTRAAEIAGDARRAGAVEGPVNPRKLEPMLARTEETPFDSPDWIYELKLDGFRLLCAKEGKEVLLLYRSGRDATHLYPEIACSVRALPFESLILDTEIAVLDEWGRPDFQRLQNRALLTRSLEIDHATVELPVIAYAFDLPALEGLDLRPLPLRERKRLLQRLLPPAGVLRYVDHIEERGKEFHARVEEMGLEGIVAKRAAAPYHGGRSADWLKLKVEREGDFAVVGYTAPKGGRSGLGALHLAAYEGGGLGYMGRVGTGFGEKQLESLREQLEPLRQEKPPCSGPVPKGAEHTWVRPELVCQVRYRERTADGMLRHPSFMRVRDDKRIEDCEAPPARRGEPAQAEAPIVRAAREFTPTNRDKVFWPDEGYTKGDLLDYYRAIATWMLPYLKNRPLVLTRYPDGIEGKSFYQKDAPSWVPDWLRTVIIPSSEREIRYFVCEDEESLLFLANMGTIPFHIWSSRADDLDVPDWCVLDLDPKEAPFVHVVKIARAIKKLCDTIELETFVKTSGSSGLHILVPLGGRCTYDQSRTLGELIARVIEAELPDIATTARVREARGGRVYIDFLQNVAGQLIAAPFTVRPLPGATVSAPLRWSEVNAKLSLDRYTIKTVPDRMKRLKDGDPMRPVLKRSPDLIGALARLAKQLSES